MGEKEKDFERLFIEAVDEGLGTLGESGKHMIFFHLDRSYSVKKHEIPKKPEAFARGLEKIFGAGASVLEKLIVKSLYSKLGLEYEDVESRPFVDYVNHVREANDAEEVRENDRGGVPLRISGHQKQNLSSNPVYYAQKQKWRTGLISIDEE